MEKRYGGADCAQAWSVANAGLSLRARSATAPVVVIPFRWLCKADQACSGFINASPVRVSVKILNRRGF